MSWRKRIGLTGVLVAFSLNVALALLSYLVLGHAMGWLSPSRAELSRVVAYGLPFAQFCLCAYFLDQGFRLFVRRWSETQAMGRSPPRLGLQLGRMLIYFVFLAMSISMVFDQSITGILAASGVVGLVMGFALRGLVSDLFFGIALHIDRNIAIGDWIDLNFRGREIYGQIQDIHWRSVVLEDAASNLVLVPNSEFAASVVINRSKPGLVTEYATHISLGNEYEAGRVIAVLEMVLSHLVGEGFIHRDPPPIVQVAAIEGGVVKYRLLYSVRPGRRAVTDTQSAVLRYSMQFLRASGIYLYPLFPNYANPDKLVSDRPQSVPVRTRVLGGVSLLHVLSAKDIETIAESAEVRMFAAGSTLIEAGEPGDTMWVIADGSFDVIVDREGSLVHVSTLWPGEWVGEMSLLTGEPRSATVRARTTSTVYAISKPIMEGLFQQDPELINTLAQIAGRRRKARERPYSPMTTSQEQAKTLSTVARIRAFFGVPAID